MRAKAKANHGSELPAEYIGTVCTPLSELHLKKGKIYDVYAMTCFMGVLSYLVVDETSVPDLVPCGAFELVDPLIPSGWEYGYSSPTAESQLSGVWGYHEFVADINHFQALIEHEKHAVELFRTINMR